MSRRKLLPFEEIEAELVFAQSINYAVVRILEDNWFALAIARLGRKLAGDPPPTTNAITLGNTIRFSRAIETKPDNDPVIQTRDTAWLIHELTHVWQYQHFGLRYLVEAARDQLMHGTDSYIYSQKTLLSDKGEDLRMMWRSGRRFHTFNREQQGDIVRDYYRTLKQGGDTNGWLPFIQELRTQA